MCFYQMGPWGVVLFIVLLSQMFSLIYNAFPFFFFFFALHLLVTEMLASNGSCYNICLLKIYGMLHNFQGIYDSWISWLPVVLSSIFDRHTNQNHSDMYLDHLYGNTLFFDIVFFGKTILYKHLLWQCNGTLIKMGDF